MRLARLHHRGARVVVDHGLPGDRVDLRIALAPVAVELLDLEVVGRLPLDELERSRADRMERDVLAAPFLQGGGADHHRRRMRELRDERRERGLERDARRVVVHDLGLGDVVVVQAVALELVVRIGHSVEVGLDRVGLEVRAVVELDALLQLDRVDESVLADLVALGQHRDQLHVLVEAEHAFVERLRHRLRQRVVGVVRVRRGERRRHGEHEVLGGVGGQRDRGGDHRAGERAVRELHEMTPWLK